MNSLYENRSAVTLLSEGCKIFGILHLPIAEREGQKFPAVLFCHGFGGNKSGRYRLYVRLAEQLAQNGIASLRFDFRGCGDSEGSFTDITISRELQDAKECISFLQAHPAIDQSRLGICGSSFGAAIACVIAAQTKAIALLAPFFDAKPWQEIVTSGQKKGNLEYDAELQCIRFLGQPLSQECLQEFTSFDLKEPLEQIAHLPLLLVQGGNDATMGQYHAEQYSRQRKTAAGKTEIVHLPLSGHDFGDPKEQEILFKAVTDWFTSHLHAR
ncbi:MAG: alpha/beta fold hydrolase [Verrucomicrobia bacterium]|nr:alpha/beta fold hydrolase [Verrucomicrobiota bacterium]